MVKYSPEETFMSKLWTWVVILIWLVVVMILLVLTGVA